MRRPAPLPTLLLGMALAAALTVAPTPAFAKDGKGPQHKQKSYEQRGHDDDRGRVGHRGDGDRNRSEQRSDDKRGRAEHRGGDDRNRSEQRGYNDGRGRGNGIEKWWQELPKDEQQRLMHD